MSTKIYNGYKTKLLTMNEFEEFVLEVKKIAKNMLEDRFYNIMANYILSIAFAATRIGNDKEKRDKFLSDLYRDAKNVWNAPKEDVDKYFSFKHIGSVVDVAEQKLLNKAMDNQFHSKNSPVYFSVQMAVKPIEDKMLVLLYDNDLEKILLSDETFIKKYCFEKYGYWNNTDQPEGITNEEWEQRRIDWEKTFDKPADTCICFEFGYDDSYAFPSYLFDEKDKLTSFISNNISKAINNEIKDVMFDKWLLDKYNGSEDDVYSKFHEFAKLKNDGKLNDLFDISKREVEEKFGWIDEKIIEYSVLELFNIRKDA